MEVIFFLLPIALLLAFGFLGAFIWAVRQGHFDDLETPSHKLLIDEKTIEGDTHGSSRSVL